MIRAVAYTRFRHEGTAITGKPRSYFLNRLNTPPPPFLRVFPKATPEEEEAFGLLAKAYVGALYRREYKITRAQLEYLGKRVKKRHTLANTICKEKMQSFS